MGLEELAESIEEWLHILAVAAHKDPYCGKVAARRRECGLPARCHASHPVLEEHLLAQIGIFYICFHCPGYILWVAHGLEACLLREAGLDPRGIYHHSRMNLDSLQADRPSIAFQVEASDLIGEKGDSCLLCQMEIVAVKGLPVYEVAFGRNGDPLARGAENAHAL